MTQMARDPVATVGKRFARFGDTYRVGEPGNALFVTRDPDHIRDVLVTGGGVFGKGHSSFRVLRQVLGDSLLISEGEDWRRQRRLVQPAFARPRLAEYASTMAHEARKLAERLATRRPHQHDLSAEMTALTLRIVARTLFGQDVDDSPRVGKGMRWLNDSFGRIDPLELLPAGVPTPTRLRARRILADLDAAVFDVIERRRQLLARGERAPADLLQRLLDARDEEGDGGGLSDKEIRDQLLTLYLAGHDTTSHAVSWTLYLLSTHPEALQRARSELRRVLGDGPAGFESLAELRYLEAAFKEAMRLYPPVVAIPRRASMDTTLGPYSVRRGDEAVVWVWHLHRDPRFYPQPERFRPERFLEGGEGVRNKHTYMPFGAGQRVCIGQMFATIEAQLILAELLRRLDLQYASQRHPGLRYGVTLAPKRGVPMQVSALT